MDENNIFQSDVNIETIMDVDSIEDQDTLLYNRNNSMCETSSQYGYSQYSLDDESLMIVEEDDDGSLSDNSEYKNKVNESTLNKMSEQIKTVSDTIENTAEFMTSDKQVPIKKKIVSAVVNTSKNSNLHTRPKNDSLNLERIAIPKSDLNNVKLNPSIISGQIKKTQSITMVSSASAKPTNTKFQPKSSVTNISCNKSFSRPKQEFKIISSNEPKSGIYVLPQNGVNYMIRTGESKNQSLKLNPATVTESAEHKQKIIVTSKVPQKADHIKFNKFVARMQKLPGGKYKVVPAQGKVPVDLENVFKRNSHFVKQKMVGSPTISEHKINDNFFIGKPVNSHQFTNIKETKQFHQNRLISAGKSWNFSNVNRDKRIIPHTITSKDLIENRKNIFIEKREIKLRSNNHEIKSSGLIQRLQRSESLNQSDGQLLNINKYGKVTRNDNLIISLGTLHKSNKKLNTTTTTDEIKVLPLDVHTSKDININKQVEEHSNAKTMLLSEEINLEEQCQVTDEEDYDRSEQFVSCQYRYCETLVHEPELIDNMYCSLMCKKLCAKQLGPEDKSNIELDEIKNPTGKIPFIDRKQLLVKLGNRIHKRKQMLSFSCPEKMSRNYDWDELDQFENSYGESPIDEKQSSQNSPHNLEKEVENDDIDDDNENDAEEMLDLKSIVNDNNLLTYMEEMQFKSAPKKLFDRPFPNEENFFKVGQKLEGIDPEHEALICVMSVVEVCGYRIKLHFDGYTAEHDFWVNADCPDLFYPRWCQENSRTLTPPKNYEIDTFDWTDYLAENNAIPAPKWNFAITKHSSDFDHKFTVGAKLEALDKLTRTLPKQLICVATVADILYNRIRIHFDGWTDDFDYWTDITSTNIHPVGWCDNNGRNLSPPSGYNDFKGKKPFSWMEYLKETNSKPVPEDAFVRRPLRDFAINTTIEIVDLVVPSLIRIAEIIDVRGDELKILYDGFHSNYAYWVEDDSPDIHPVGWTLKTNHPIEIPPAINNLSSCQIMGCNGKGNANDKFKNEHIVIRDCPYELDAWKLAVAGLEKLPDRIKTDNVPTSTTFESELKTQVIEQNEDEKLEKCKLNNNLPNLPKQKENIINNKSNEQLGIKNIKPEYSNNLKKVLVKHNISSITNNSDNDLRNSIGLSFMPDGLTLNNLSLGKQDDNKLWTRHNAQFGTPLFDTTNVLKWTPEQVAYYVNQVVPVYSNYKTRDQISIPDRFIDHEIDGEAFLMLNQDELMNILKIPLGHALKIHCAIMMFRNRVPIFDFIETTYCPEG